MRILIVLDDGAASSRLCAILERAGHDVVAAASGVEGALLAGTQDFGLVVADLVMSDMDGLDLCRRVRAQGGDTYTYVVIVTARGCMSERLEALAAGADDYLVKPVDPADVLARLVVAERMLHLYAELSRQRAELARATAQLARMVVTDSLTGLGDRRRFSEQLMKGYSLARRHDVPLAVAMLDVDHFKAYNDTFGHMAGDDVLRQVAGLLCAALRHDDCVARYGGEEFALLLSGSDNQGTAAAAERVRRSIQDHAWLLRPVTASVGLASYTPACSGPEELLRQADRALYQAKRMGRNRVVRYTHEDTFEVLGGEGAPEASRVRAPTEPSGP